MLLSILRDRGVADAPGYQMRPIRAFVDLDRTGLLLGFTENANEKAKRGAPVSVPSRKRSSAPRPLLFADGPDYLFGLDGAGSPSMQAVTRRDLHLALAERCVDATANTPAAVSRDFLRAVRNDSALRAEVASLVAGYPGDLCFRVEHQTVTDELDVKRFWAQDLGLVASDGAPGPKCGVCGQPGLMAEIWPVSIRGIPGGQTSGTQLVSMNAEVFESFGQVRASGSMTCALCGERIVNALNALLADRRYRTTIGQVAYLAWHREDKPFDFFHAVLEPEPELVRRLLKAPLTAEAAHLEAKDGDLVTLALTANASRAVIRSWDLVPIPEVRRRLKRYFEAQMVVGQWGEAPTPSKLAALAGATVRSFDDLQPDVVTSLLRGILAGSPLPPFLASRVLRRVAIQDPPKVTQPQAALLTWFLTQSQKEMAVPHQLDTSLESPAYLCGRALAELDAIQRSAQGKVNATVVDRYFGAASSRPATVLGMLVRNSQDHFKKLRGSNEAAAIAHDRRLTEILDLLSAGPIPATLSLTDQTLFCLGFYHQRAEGRRAIQKRRGQDGARGPSDEPSKEDKQS
jgi:CRISPR-associated protein Csd1